MEDQGCLRGLQHSLCLQFPGSLVPPRPLWVPPTPSFGFSSASSDPYPCHCPSNFLFSQEAGRQRAHALHPNPTARPPDLAGRAWGGGPGQRGPCHRGTLTSQVTVPSCSAKRVKPKPRYPPSGSKPSPSPLSAQRAPGRPPERASGLFQMGAQVPPLPLGVEAGRL